jgi:hypothetical protein
MMKNYEEIISGIIKKIADYILGSIDDISKSKKFDWNESEQLEQIKFLSSIFDEIKSKMLQDASLKEDVSKLIKIAFKKVLEDKFDEYEGIIDSRKDEILESFINYVFWFIVMNIKEKKFAYSSIYFEEIIWLFFKACSGVVEVYLKPDENKKIIEDKIKNILDVFVTSRQVRYNFHALIENVIKTTKEYEKPKEVEFDIKQIEKVESLRKIIIGLMKSINDMKIITEIVEKEILEEKLGDIKTSLTKEFAKSIQELIKKILSGASDIVFESKPLKSFFDEIVKIIEQTNENIKESYGKAWTLINYLIKNVVMGITPEEKEKLKMIGFKMLFSVDFKKHVDDIYELLEEINKTIELTKSEKEALKRSIAIILEEITPEKLIVREVRKISPETKPTAEEVYIPYSKEEEEEIIKRLTELNIGINKKSFIDFKNIMNIVKSVFNNIKGFIAQIVKIVKSYQKIKKILIEIEKKLSDIDNLLLKEKEFIKTQYINNKFIQIKAEEKEEEIKAWFYLQYNLKSYLDTLLNINKRIQQKDEKGLIEMLKELANILNMRPPFELKDIVKLKELDELVQKIEKMNLKTEKELEISKRMKTILRFLDNINTHASEIIKEIELNLDKNKGKVSEIVFQLSKSRIIRTSDIIKALEKMTLEGEKGEMLRTFVLLSENMYLGYNNVIDLLNKIKEAIYKLDLEIKVQIKPMESTKEFRPVVEFPEIEEAKKEIEDVHEELKHQEENISIPFNKLTFEEKVRVISILKRRFTDPNIQKIIDTIRRNIQAIKDLLKDPLFNNIREQIDSILQDILDVLKIYDVIKDIDIDVEDIENPENVDKVEQVSSIFKSKNIKMPEEIFEKLMKIDLIRKFIETLENIQKREIVLNFESDYKIIKEIIEEVARNPQEKDKIIETKLSGIPELRRKIIKDIIDLLPIYQTDKGEVDESALKYLFELFTYKPKKYYHLEIKKKSQTDIMILINDLSRLIEELGKESIKFLNNANEILKVGYNWLSSLSEVLKEIELKEEKEEEIKEEVLEVPQIAPAFAEIKQEVLKKIAYFTPNYMTYKEYDLSKNRLKILNAGNEKFIILSKDNDLKVGDRVEITKYPISKTGIIIKKESDTMYRVVFDGIEDLVHILYLKKIN